MSQESTIENATEVTTTAVLEDADIVDAPPQGESAATDNETEGDAPPFAVRDKRFWARGDAEPEEEAKKPSYIEQLEQQVRDKDERLQATLLQYKEALDEFENAKARLRRDINKEIDAGKRAILGELLDVVDNLERAISAAGAASGGSLLAGVTMVRDGFMGKLQNLGVRRLEAIGQKFDPARFEAVSIVPVNDPAQDGVVVGVVRDCYLIGDDTLRHGMVAVGKAPEAPKDAA